ncbi:28497_t:CDS:2 [Dentiscutata erythropus]|uniref:28497_t:CDS:1 n=1 Tax=Dentiscutata erythropus TaxID=1348616 RepID=A0A9N9HLN3_9GLOM|nr:28497_t:CDS:2 [Dentiscutata erythropus]
MSTVKVGKILGWIGFLLLFHSAYSTYEHLSYLKAVDKIPNYMPIEITVECLVSVSICTIGIILAAGPLKPILIKHGLAKKTIDEIDTHPSFNTFNHRGRLMKSS